MSSIKIAFVQGHIEALSRLGLHEFAKNASNFLVPGAIDSLHGLPTARLQQSLERLAPTMEQNAARGAELGAEQMGLATGAIPMSRGAYTQNTRALEAQGGRAGQQGDLHAAISEELGRRGEMPGAGISETGQVRVASALEKAAKMLVLDPGAANLQAGITGAMLGSGVGALTADDDARLQAALAGGLLGGGAGAGLNYMGQRGNTVANRLGPDTLRSGGLGGMGGGLMGGLIAGHSE